MIRALGCCVRYIHHVGQEAARSGSRDQYTGRGGTALPDGSRMVAVLTQLDSHEDAPPVLRTILEDGGQLMELVLPKLSYCAPQQSILIARDGWRIEWCEKPSEDETMEERAAADELAAMRFIQAALDKGQKHTRRSAEEQHELSGLPRNRLRAALGRLLADGRVQQVELPESERRGSRTHYLKPITKVLQ